MQKAGYAVIVLAILLTGATVGALDGLLGAIASITVLLGAMVLWNYRVGVILAALMLPFSATELIPREMFGVTGLNPLNVVLAATVFSFFLAWLFQRRENEIPVFPPLFWLFVLPISLAAVHGTLYVHLIPSSELLDNPFSTAGGYLMSVFLKPMIIVVVAMLVAIMARNSRRPGVLLVPLFFSAAVLELVVVAYVAVSGVSLNTLAGDSLDSRTFLSWVGMHANSQGLLFNMALALALFTFSAIRWGVARVLLAAFIALSTVAIALTFSRGGFLGLLLIALYFFLTRRKARLLLTGLVLVTVVALVLPQAIIHRATTGFAGEDVNKIGAGRIDMIWTPLAPTIAEKPLLGHGLDSTLWSTPVRAGIMPPVGHPHNAYLRLLLDLGFVGTMVIALFYRRLWRLFRQLKEKPEEPLWRGFFEGASVCILVLAVQGLTDDSFTPTFSQSYMWLAAGLAIGLAQRIQSRGETPVQPLPKTPRPKAARPTGGNAGYAPPILERNISMKICFLGLQDLPVLAPEYNRHYIGGEEVQHTLVARALARRGHRVSMVVADYGQEDGASWDGIRTYKAYRLDAGMPVLRFFHPRWTGVWSALRRADADIYYVSCAGMQLGLTAMFCRWYGRRLVFRIASDTDCDPHRLLIPEQPLLHLRDKWLYEYGLQRAHGILAQSERQRQAMLANYGRESRIAAMLVEKPKQNIPYPERDIDVLWVGNIRPVKRPDLAIALAERIPGIRLHMVGGGEAGSPQLYDEIRKKASTVPNLVFHGRVPYHEVGVLYERAKVFVNTSDFEGFPNTYLQSWVRGVPVVAFFDPDGLIKREGLGRAASSLDEMAESIKRYLADSEALETVGARCRAYMAKEYGEDRVLAPYFEVFESAYKFYGKRGSSRWATA